MENNNYFVIFNRSSWWSSWLTCSKRHRRTPIYKQMRKSQTSLKRKMIEFYTNTFGVSISNYFYFVPWWSCGTCKSNSEVRQKVPSKAIGNKVGIWNSFSLDGSPDASLGPEMMFNWLDCMDTIHITSKLGREEPLKPTNISLYIM